MEFVARVVAVAGRIGLGAARGGTRDLCGTRELDADKTGRDVDVELVVLEANVEFDVRALVLAGT